MLPVYTVGKFYFDLCFHFHTSLFWVLILAAGGPYWVLISQKNGSLLGPYLKAWESLLVLEAVHFVVIKRFKKNPEQEKRT